MRMETIETGDPSHMPIACGSKTDSQERDPRMFLVEEGNGNVECSPLFYAWSGLARHLAPLPSAAVRSALILLFTGGLKGEVGGLSC